MSTSQSTRLANAVTTLDSVDQLLSNAGFAPDSSTRHQLSIARSLIHQEMPVSTRVRMTIEDERIYDRMDSMSPQFIYEDAADSDYERILWIMRARARFDLASPAVRIEG